MKARVVIDLTIPKSFKGRDPWTKEQALDSYISHWLEEGYGIQDYNVELPDGIKYNGYKIEYPKEWEEGVK